MLVSIDNLLEDIERVNRIPIVPNMLEVIIRTTGLRFAAIARVTEDRWIACSVRDEINFGLESGGELQIKTTLCDEVRQSKELIVINHVAEDEAYRNHQTPKMYGFQSYISVPIFLKDGNFFGTLCAIDPDPAVVNDTKTIGLFTMFADLIAFHLESLDLMAKSDRAIRQLSKQVSDTAEENQQYKFISHHNLAEPLRKLRFFSSVLLKSVDNGDSKKAKDLAVRVDASAQRLSMMLNDLSDYTELTANQSLFEIVDLNKVVSDVCFQLDNLIESKNALIKLDVLPKVNAISIQMEQLFFHLLSNALKFSRTTEPPRIHISVKSLTPEEVYSILKEKRMCYRIDISDNGQGIERENLEGIFNIFSKFTYQPTNDGYGLGLAYCKKIVSIHRGSILAESRIGEGSIFTFIPPRESN